jgi:hypothetical protein
MFSITKQEINLKYHRFLSFDREKEDKQLIGSSVGLKEVVRYQEKTQLWMPHNTNMNELKCNYIYSFLNLNCSIVNKEIN